MIKRLTKKADSKALSLKGDVRRRPFPIVLNAIRESGAGFLYPPDF